MLGLEFRIQNGCIDIHTAILHIQTNGYEFKG